MPSSACHSHHRDSHSFPTRRSSDLRTDCRSCRGQAERSEKIREVLPRLSGTRHLFRAVAIRDRFHFDCPHTGGHRKHCKNCSGGVSLVMTSSTLPRIRAVSKFFFEGDRKFFIKGATYGPFAPDEKGNTFGRPEQVDVDLRKMREIGLNVLRVYHPPPEWFLEKCFAAGMRVLITLPW